MYRLSYTSSAAAGRSDVDGSHVQHTARLFQDTSLRSWQLRPALFDTHQMDSRVERQDAANWRRGKAAVLEHLRCPCKCALGAWSASASSGQILQSLPSLLWFTEQFTSPTAAAHLRCLAQPQAGCCLTWLPCAGPACDRAAIQRAHGLRCYSRLLSRQAPCDFNIDTSGTRVCLAKLRQYSHLQIATFYRC